MKNTKIYPLIFLVISFFTLLFSGIFFYNDRNTLFYHPPLKTDLIYTQGYAKVTLFSCPGKCSDYKDLSITSGGSLKFYECPSCFDNLDMLNNQNVTVGWYLPNQNSKSLNERFEPRRRIFELTIDNDKILTYEKSLKIIKQRKQLSLRNIILTTIGLFIYLLFCYRWISHDRTATNNKSVEKML